MSNKFLNQEEIEALLNAKEPEPEEAAEISEQIPLEPAGAESTAQQQANNADETAEQPSMEPVLLTAEEKDALGEIGNICMGSSSTTLSTLLNQPVNITSPKVEITTLEELYESFFVPHMAIRVEFTEGFSGYNLLIMKLHDAAVMADLMMGGDGTKISEELTDISASAASEAMNQMIGAASTAMATMFSRTVNISPPITKIYRNRDELSIAEQSQVVIVWFKMTIGKILDTQIMQVLDMAMATEEAGLILDQLSEVDGAEYPQVQEETTEHALPEKEKEACLPQTEEGRLLTSPNYVQQDKATQKANGVYAIEQQPGIKKGSAHSSENGSPAVTPTGIDQRRLELILDIPLKVSVLLGRARWPIKDILGLKPGSVVELQSLVDEPVEVLVNGTLVAMGEVVVVNENFGVRLTNIIKPEDRLKNLRR